MNASEMSDEFFWACAAHAEGDAFRFGARLKHLFYAYMMGGEL